VVTVERRLSYDDGGRKNEKIRLQELWVMNGDSWKLKASKEEQP
jgi:hypothetical protein